MGNLQNQTTWQTWTTNLNYAVKKEIELSLTNILIRWSNLTIHLFLKTDTDTMSLWIFQ